MTSNLNNPTRLNKNNDLQNWAIFRDKRVKKRISKPYQISLSILIVIIICFSGYSCYNYFANSNEQLFKRNFECYNIGNDRVFDHLQAISNYKEKKFDKAIELFSELYKKDSILGSNAFYLAISHVKCENYYTAIDLFKKITIDKGNLYKNNSNWYLGLCYLKLHKNKEARHCFELLLSEENEYTKNAQKILGQMKK